MNAPTTPGSLAGLEQAAHLHALAERIHNAADDLPAPESTHSLASVSEEVEEQVRVIAHLFTVLASEAAFHSRAATRHPGPTDSLAHRKIGLMTRAAGPLGRALAELGEAVVRIGRLHEIGAAPRTPERAQAISRARAVLDERLFHAHRHLTHAACNLHRDADRLVRSAPGIRRSPAPPPAALPQPSTVPSTSALLSPTAPRTRR